MHKSKSEKLIVINTETHLRRVYLGVLNPIIQGDLEFGAKFQNRKLQVFMVLAEIL
ncbi:MAG: hypothetical protein GKC53_05780 [Neisseriaceae bacterium]|nr:MAG: hypothetical protein GKC53_05780 [Neisseriaceae bacterium]